MAFVNDVGEAEGVRQRADRGGGQWRRHNRGQLQSFDTEVPHVQDISAVRFGGPPIPSEQSVSMAVDDF